MEPRLWMVYFKKDDPTGHRVEQINGRIIVAAANPGEAEEVASTLQPRFRDAEAPCMEVYQGGRNSRLLGG